MHIHFDSEKQFKIELDADDMNELNITFKQMDYNDEHTREVLQGLLKRIGVPGGFEAESGRIMIEVFPKSGDGCIVQYTSIDAPDSRPVVRMRRARLEAAVYEFSDIDDMLAARDALRRDEGVPWELYLVDGSYRAVLYTDRDERRSDRILGEFAKTVTRGNAAAAYTAEHGERVEI